MRNVKVDKMREAKVDEIKIGKKYLIAPKYSCPTLYPIMCGVMTEITTCRRLNSAATSDAIVYTFTKIFCDHTVQYYIYTDKLVYRFYVFEREEIEMRVTNRILQAIIGDPNFKYYQIK